MRSCLDPIEFAPTAKGPGSATCVMAQDGWRCRKERYALPATPTEAVNARIAVD